MDMPISEALEILAKVATDGEARRALRAVENELDRLRDQVNGYRSDEMDRKYGPDI